MHERGRLAAQHILPVERIQVETTAVKAALRGQVIGVAPYAQFRVVGKAKGADIERIEKPAARHRIAGSRNRNAYRAVEWKAQNDPAIGQRIVVHERIDDIACCAWATQR